MPTSEGKQPSERAFGSAPAAHWVSRPHLVALLLITILGAGLRFYHLDAQSTWHDENFSVAHSVKSLDRLFPILIDDYVHPPLHYLVLHAWFDLAGYGAWQARLISAILGTLSIPLLYLLARRFADSATSLCAAFLLTLSQLAVYFSQEARPYMQTQFLSLAAALSFLAFLEKPSFARSAWFTLAALALLYTHYYGAGTLLALGIYWIVYRREYSPLVFRRLFVVVLVIAAGFAPWILAVRSNFKIGPKRAAETRVRLNEPVGITTPLVALNRFNNAKFESMEASTTKAQALLCFAIFTFPAMAALWPGRGRPLNGAVLGCLLAAIPVGMAIMAGAANMVFNFRHFSFAVPGYYLLVAIGWSLLFQQWVLRSAWVAIVSVTCGLALYAMYTVPNKTDYRAGFAPLARLYLPGDCISNRPKRFRNKPLLGWEVYNPDKILKPTVWEELPNMPAGCARLWVAWDKTWWMNVNQEAEAEDERLQQRMREKLSVAARFQHPAVDLELFVRRPQ